MNQCQSYLRLIKRMGNATPQVSVWQSIVNTCNSNAGKTYTDSVSTFGSVGTASNKWANGALAANGKIYCRPVSATSILVIDTSDDTTTTISGVSGSWPWSNFVLGEDGYIYGAPFNASTFIKIDPSNDTFTTFNSTVGNGWGAICASGNHLIYGFKTTASPTSVLVFDPISGVQSTIETSVDTKGRNNYRYHPNGCIYAVPSGAESCYKFDTVNNTSSTIGTFSTATSDKYLGSSLSYNGCIYGVPGSVASILKIDAANSTASTFGSLGTANNKWYGGVLAPNGCIYCIPFNTGSILKINTTNNTSSTFGSLGTAALKWHGGILAPNGCIYGIPRSSSKVLKINPGANVNTNFSTKALLSAYLNG